MQEFGLIGKPLSHSFSKKYFEEKFANEGIKNASYELFELADIHDFTNLISTNSNLSGLNVTIPYKEAILPFLDEVDAVAQQIGAVNCIQLKKLKGKKVLKGFNTDVLGFQQSLKPFLAKEHHRALIFGTGGSSKAVAFVLRQLEIPFFWVSREPGNKKQTVRYQDLNQNVLKSFPILINCTPVGMFPNNNHCLPIDLEGIEEKHLVYDLIYNPIETVLLKAAKAKGAIAVNGLSMLKLQAEAAWKIWQEK